MNTAEIPVEGQAVIANTEMALAGVELAIRMLAGHRDALAKLERSATFMENVGAVLQPTFYRDVFRSRNVTDNIDAAKAALDFLAAIESNPTWSQLLAQVSGRASR